MNHFFGINNVFTDEIFESVKYIFPLTKLLFRYLLRSILPTMWLLLSINQFFGDKKFTTIDECNGLQTIKKSVLIIFYYRQNVYFVDNVKFTDRILLTGKKSVKIAKITSALQFKFSLSPIHFFSLSYLFLSPP